MKRTRKNVLRSSLREKAEQQLFMNHPANDGPLTEVETNRLFHELQVHQIELEMQNEELKKIQEQLDAEQEIYKELYDFAPTGYLSLDRYGLIRKSNLTAAKIIGMERSQLKNRRFALFVSPEFHQAFKELLQRAFMGPLFEESSELILTRKEGSLVHVKIDAVVSKGGKECLVALSDITELKTMEKALRESEIYYRTILEYSGMPMIIVNEDTSISQVNREFERVFEYTQEEVRKHCWRQYVRKEDVELFLENHRKRRIDPESVPRNYEVTLLTKSGQVKDMYATVGMIPETGKSVMSFLDITPLKKVEEALAQNEALYRNFFENATIGMFQTLPDGRFLRINKAFATMLGYDSPEDLLSCIANARDLYAHPEDREALFKELENREWFFGRHTRYRKDGRIMAGEVAIRKILNPDGTTGYLEGIVQDVTQREQVVTDLKNEIARRKETEQALSKSEKELQARLLKLREMNTALRVLMKTMGRDHEENREKFIIQMKEQILLYLGKLKKTSLTDAQSSFIKAAEAYLELLTGKSSPFLKSTWNIDSDGAAGDGLT